MSSESPAKQQAPRHLEWQRVKELVFDDQNFTVSDKIEPQEDTKFVLAFKKAYD